MRGQAFLDARDLASPMMREPPCCNSTRRMDPLVAAKGVAPDAGEISLVLRTLFRTGALWSAVRRLCDPTSVASVRAPPLAVTREVGRVAGLLMACLAQYEPTEAAGAGGASAACPPLMLQLSTVEAAVADLARSMCSGGGSRMAHHLPALLGPAAQYR